MALKPMEFRDRWVLVTGASSGLGRDIARLLATEHGAKLMLVARRGPKLRELACELEASVGTDVRIIEADLSRDADVDRVFTEATQLGEVYGVVLNAGVTHFGHHGDLTHQAFQSMLATNVTSVVRLTTLFTPYLVERGQAGGVMIVGSLAGLTPIPFQSAYSGTKAFLAQFARAYAEELSGKNVSLTLFTPGGIATELTETSGLGLTFNNSAAVMPSEDCARAALDGFRRRRRMSIPGWMNKLSALLTKLMPESLSTCVVATAYRKALTNLEVSRERARSLTVNGVSSVHAVKTDSKVGTPL
jgi:short-subunit dehydrogenase